MANGNGAPGGSARASALAAIPLLLGLAAAGIEMVDGEPEGGQLLPGSVVEVVFFDVGQGDCAVLTTTGPDPQVVVIDGGFVGTARESVTPYLRARGITEIDLMILTHPDMDHVSGLRRLIQDFDVHEIWDPGFESDTDTYADFRQLAETEAGDRYYRPFDEQIVDSTADDQDDEAERLVVIGQAEEFEGFRIIPLHSSRFLDGPNDAYRVNNSSIVVKVEVGDNSILFTGDANGRSPGIEDDEREEEALFTEAALLAVERDDPGALRSTILKIPHHGSLSSSSHQFVEAVQPQWAIVSSGFSTNHDLPRAGTLARYGASRANILRTDALDSARTTGDDHLVLLMGEREGELIWRQASTRSLLEPFGD